MEVFTIMQFFTSQFVVSLNFRTGNLFPKCAVENLNFGELYGGAGLVLFVALLGRKVTVRFYHVVVFINGPLITACVQTINCLLLKRASGVFEMIYKYVLPARNSNLKHLPPYLHTYMYFIPGFLYRCWCHPTRLIQSLQRLLQTYMGYVIRNKMQSVIL